MYYSQRVKVRKGTVEYTQIETLGVETPTVWTFRRHPDKSCSSSYSSGNSSASTVRVTETEAIKLLLTGAHSLRQVDWLSILEAQPRGYLSRLGSVANANLTVTQLCPRPQIFIEMGVVVEVRIYQKQGDNFRLGWRVLRDSSEPSRYNIWFRRPSSKQTEFENDTSCLHRRLDGVKRQKLGSIYELMRVRDATPATLRAGGYPQYDIHIRDGLK